MRERPILFSAPMVRALMDGTKTQTRRALRTQPNSHHWESIPGYELKRSKIVTINERCAVKFSHSIPQNPVWDTALDWLVCPYGQPGDRLWVREAWRADGLLNGVPPRDIPKGAFIAYEGGRQEVPWPAAMGKLRPGMFMPRWASRILLDVAAVRVERLHAISAADCIAEGAPGGHGAIPGYGYAATPLEHYRHVWESINSAGSWDANPWVWVIDFARLP